MRNDTPAISPRWQRSRRPAAAVAELQCRWREILPNGLRDGFVARVARIPYSPCTPRQGIPCWSLIREPDRSAGR